mgnify:CR=1 FL=1
MPLRCWLLLVVVMASSSSYDFERRAADLGFECRQCVDHEDHDDNEEDPIDLKSLTAPNDWALTNGLLSFCDEISVLLPPWWPLRIQLGTSVYRFGFKIKADEFGCVNLLEAMATLIPHIEFLAAARITLDAGELGEIHLKHHRKLNLENMHGAIGQLWDDFVKRKDQLLLEPDLLFQLWLTPLFGEWRGRLELMPDEHLLQQDGALRLYQWVNCEWERNKVLANSMPLLLTETDIDALFVSGGILREACEKYLQTVGKRRMLVTDGLRFVEIRKNSNLKLRWFEMKAMVDDLDLFEAWLGELEGGA